MDARYRALVTAGEDTDSFVVDITDSLRRNQPRPRCDVTIAPPSATAIDQRATTVAVNTQQMYFYSQADTDKALGAAQGRRRRHHPDHVALGRRRTRGRHLRLGGGGPDDQQCQRQRHQGAGHHQHHTGLGRGARPARLRRGARRT